MGADITTLEGALQVLGQLLYDRDLRYDVVVIGGGSLLLLGLMDRTTKDLDVVALMKDRALLSADPLPQPLIQAVKEVGIALNLSLDWMNTGPASLFNTGLPQGFMDRLHARKYKGLTLYLADRLDQICFKLYAAVDQGPQSKHFSDLSALHPSIEELIDAKQWCISQDPSPPFIRMIDEVIECLKN